MKGSDSFNRMESNSQSMKKLFAFDTYYSLIIKLLTGFALGHRNDKAFTYGLFEDEAFYKTNHINNFVIEKYFDWYLHENCHKNNGDGLLSITKKIFDDYLFGYGDFLKIIHQSLFSRQSRQRTGEYFTPDWLVDFAVKLSGYSGENGTKVLDPSCGSGSFLLFAAKRIIRLNTERKLKPQSILNMLHGFDINPLAVMAAKANLIFALKDYLPFGETVEFNIFRKDILDENGADCEIEFDFILGNPPWLNWKSISDEYKKKVIPIAVKYNLFTQKGLRARLGFAEDDISSIITYISIDRYLKEGGKLAFILPQSLFQSIGGGEGFRSFYLPNIDKGIKIDKVVDLVQVNPFKSASNRAALFIAEKGSRNTYPVQYHTAIKDSRIQSFENLDEFEERIKLEKGFAEPIDNNQITSPWIITPDSGILKLLRSLMRESSYKARAGVCTWMSGVYWVDVINQYEKYSRIQNNPDLGKIEIPKIESDVENSLIYPLIRGREIERWHISAKGNIIFPQDCKNPAKAMNEREMELNFNMAYNYFSQFRNFLVERKGYKKFLAREPFYAVYDAGVYTLSPYKVGWRYLSKKMSAAVIYNYQEKTIIPDLNVITISAGSLEEAYYLSALLNSSIVQIIIETYGECLRITPGIMKQLPIPAFDKDLHKELAVLAEDSHINFKDRLKVKENEAEIDELFAYILKINRNDLNRIKEYLNEG